MVDSDIYGVFGTPASALAVNAGFKDSYGFENALAAVVGRSLRPGVASEKRSVLVGGSTATWGSIALEVINQLAITEKIADYLQFASEDIAWWAAPVHALWAEHGPDYADQVFQFLAWDMKSPESRLDVVALYGRLRVVYVYAQARVRPDSDE